MFGVKFSSSTSSSNWPPEPVASTVSPPNSCQPIERLSKVATLPYFLLIVPFLAILATVGLYAIASRVLEPGKPLWAVLPVSMLLVFGLGKSLYSHGQQTGDWSPYERMAKTIDEVTTAPQVQHLAARRAFLAKNLGKAVAIVTNPSAFTMTRTCIPITLSDTSFPSSGCLTGNPRLHPPVSLFQPDAVF